MKKIYVKDIKPGENIVSSFMIMKKLYSDGSKTIAYIGDSTGDIKASIANTLDTLEVGDVIKANGVLETLFEVNEFEKLKDFENKDYLPVVSRPIEDIMEEIEKLSKEEFKSKEAIALNDYFFKDKKFIKTFQKGIGGVSQHHNYIGGLAEHTLNVMYLARVLAYRYNCRNKELAILGAKLHDIGKIEEYFVDGPFSFTLKGEMEGHIVIGVQMLEKAFNENPEIYSEDFKQRIKACIIQHHGKLEYGSPKKPNTEEAFIVHFADHVDADMNKLGQIRENGKPNTWSPYDRRIEGKLYI